MDDKKVCSEFYSEAVIKASLEYSEACQYLSECTSYAFNARRNFEEAVYKAKKQNFENEKQVLKANEKVKEAGLKAAAAWAAWSSNQYKAL